MPSTTTKLRTELAGRSLELVVSSDLAHLACAFAPLTNFKARCPDFSLNITVDPQAMKTVSGLAGFNQHYRRADEHIWVASAPPQVQKLDFGRSQPVTASLMLADGLHVDGSIRARPGVETISAWAAANEILPLHASAVTLNDQALLLVGESGSGKSTTALALAERGWKLIADDRCFMTLEGSQAFLHGLYASAVVTKDALHRLEAQNWGDLGATHHGKFARSVPASMFQSSRTRLVGVVWVAPALEPEIRCRALTRREALSPWQSALAPTLQALGPSAKWLRQLATLSQSVPAWHLRIDWNFAKIDTVLRNILLGGGPTDET